MDPAKTEDRRSEETRACDLPTGDRVLRKPRKVAFWRAVAAMAAMLAVASAIVTVETSKELIARGEHYRHEIVLLRQRVARLRHGAAINRKRLAEARREIALRTRLEGVLLAPDVETATLFAPSTRKGVSAIVAISRGAGAAVLMATGLSALPERQVYAAWWTLKGGHPEKAAEFRAASDGTATVLLRLPPHGTTVTACVVTTERSAGRTAPSGPVRLKGRVAARR